MDIKCDTKKFEAGMRRASAKANEFAVSCTSGLTPECRVAVESELDKLIGGCKTVVVFDGDLKLMVSRRGEVRGRVMTAEEREHLKREWHAQYGKGV